MCGAGRLFRPGAPPTSSTKIISVMVKPRTTSSEARRACCEGVRRFGGSSASPATLSIGLSIASKGAAGSRTLVLIGPAETRVRWFDCKSAKPVREEDDAAGGRRRAGRA